MKKIANDTYLVATCDLNAEEIRDGYPICSAIAGSSVIYVMFDSYSKYRRQGRRRLKMKLHFHHFGRVFARWMFWSFPDDTDERLFENLANEGENLIRLSSA